MRGGTGVDKRVRNLIEAMIIQRIIAPGSKLAFHRALAPATATSSLALSVGLIDVAEREVYAALDWLIEQQTRIEAALAKKAPHRRHLGALRRIIELHGGPLPGSSARPSADRVRIAVRADGAPVAVEVFEGNTSDPQTIREQIDRPSPCSVCRLLVSSSRTARAKKNASRISLLGVWQVKSSA